MHDTLPPGPISDATARALAAAIRDRLLGAGQFTSDPHFDRLPSGAVRLEVTVAVLVDPETARTIATPGPEFYDDACPIAEHEHRIVGTFGAFCGGILWECTTTLHRWNTERTDDVDGRDR